MDTRRCALFLIKCVQGFAAISRKWMTWRCNSLCLSLLLLSKAFFPIHATLHGRALQITFLCSCACGQKRLSVFYLFRMKKWLQSVISIFVSVCSFMCASPTFDRHTAQLLCHTQLGTTHPPPPQKQHPNQRLYLDTMPSPG